MRAIQFFVTIIWLKKKEKLFSYSHYLAVTMSFFQIHLLHMEIVVQGNNLRNIRHIEVVICQITYPSNLRIIASLHEFNCNKKKPQALLTVSLRKECVGEIQIKEMMEEKYF